MSPAILNRINIIADKILLSAFAEGTHNLTAKHVMAAVEDCLARVGMTGAGGRRLKKFSKGMLQRIGHPGSVIKIFQGPYPSLLHLFHQIQKKIGCLQGILQGIMGFKLRHAKLLA